MIERADAARLLGVLQYGSEGPSQPLVGVIELSLALVCAWLTIRRSEPIERGS